MYKLIAIDIDGTLLNSKRELTQETIDTISEAQSRGVKVVLASGRPIEGMRKHLDMLNMTSDDDFVIHFNGSIVESAATGQIIHSEILTGADAKLIASTARDLKVNTHAFSKNIGLITPKTSKYTSVESTINNIKIHELDFSQLDDNHAIIKAMIVDEPELLDLAINQLPDSLHDKFTIVRSADCFLEFLNPKSNKGLAVQTLAETLKIPQERVMCIGDAGNDRHMVEYAGLGVAMGNAMEETKNVADYITDTNDQNGVAKAIRKFVLC
ncbi:Cof-type HAD-IIB family hydrolase [Vibrio salinus]|uniref:Cof-type HAD-IIB family hydrolase n=1 Tax=Vibrio salinus TaxID=2899784 RepID=UPI001E44B9E6|nr:Cof-type HAD-IIB family hydrolase [Vibrio salinus]MCE0492468.1 Cof-type HAD-IIB family hydrolase [Vibrio salinus]